MYNITVSGQETLVGSAISVSLSETTDEGRSTLLATWTSFCGDQYDDLPHGSLEAFLEQISTAVVNSLSSNGRRL